MSDERIERIRSYLKTNHVWGMDKSDMSYLVQALDTANARIAALEAELHEAMTANRELVDFIQGNTQPVQTTLPTPLPGTTHTAPRTEGDA